MENIFQDRKPQSKIKKYEKVLVVGERLGLAVHFLDGKTEAQHYWEQETWARGLPTKPSEQKRLRLGHVNNAHKRSPILEKRVIYMKAEIICSTDTMNLQAFCCQADHPFNSGNPQKG